MTLKSFNFRLFLGLLFLWVFQVGTSIGMTFLMYIFSLPMYLGILVFSLICSWILKRKMNTIAGIISKV